MLKPFQRIFFKINSLNSQTPHIISLSFSYNYTLSNRISFIQKKDSFGLNSIQTLSLFWCLYSHKNYKQHKSISKAKILRPFGLYNSGNGKEQPM